MTHLKDTFKDILKHTYGLGIFEMVRITGLPDSTGIETVDPNKTVIVKAVTNEPVAEFVDTTVGLRALNTLDGFLKYPGYDAEDGTMKVVTQDRNGTITPFSVDFKSADGDKSNYRLAVGAVLDQQMATIEFKGADFKINIVPEEKIIKRLGLMNSTLSLTDMTFTPKTDGTTLSFQIGDGSSDSANIIINNDISGSLSTERQFPLDVVLKILKLSDSGLCVLSINDKLIQITIDSGLGIYTYIIPPKQ